MTSGRETICRSSLAHRSAIGFGVADGRKKRAMIDWWGPVIVETYGGSETGIATICTSAEWHRRFDRDAAR